MADPSRSFEEIRQELLESLRAGFLFGRHDEPLDAAGTRIVRCIEQRLALLPGGWQAMESAPKDGTPFLVTWAPSRMGSPKVCVEMVGGYDEYEECRSYGEPEAYGWHPLPRALVSPMSAVPLPDPKDSQ